MRSESALSVCLTFDVEERFHSHLTAADAPRDWCLRDRIAMLVDWLHDRGKVATFFVVGEWAEAYPELVRRMAQGGSEVGSHSHQHLRMDRANAGQCRQDITRSKSVLEDLTGQPVHGFRAPSWSATLSDEWLWEHLVALGFCYDSSLFPVWAGMYGSRMNPANPFRVYPGLLEIPPSVHRLGPVRIPYGGSFYFRCYPDWLTGTFLRRDAAVGRTPLLYFHPWDFQPATEVVENTFAKRFVGSFRVRSAWRRFAELVAQTETLTLRERCKQLRGEG